MRDFGEADKKKKRARIKIPENPARLSDEVLSQLQDTVKRSLREGNLPCGVAFRISRDSGIPKIAIGEMADRLGVRVTNCQIGCFKVDKIIHDPAGGEEIDPAVLSKLEALKEKDALTCASVFDLAAQLKMTPMYVASNANARNLRVRQCQLGCF